MLEAARSRRLPLPEIVLWIAASRSPSESQTSECSDLLSRSRATFVIVAQRQPAKLHNHSCRERLAPSPRCNAGGVGKKIRNTHPSTAPTDFVLFPDQGRYRNKVGARGVRFVTGIRKPIHQFWFRTFRRRNIST